MQKSKASQRRVSIIVPVYGDWESLQECVQALKKYVDTSRHKVLLVNDCGPDHKEIEQKLQASIRGVSGFEYYANEVNLGFVKNCNKAVFELDRSTNDILLLNSDAKVTEGFLDELLTVLYADPSHGTVSPRSNSATIASVPFRFKDGRVEQSPEYGYEVYANVKELLPRFSISPVSPGFCLLIKRDIIQKYGLFDEIYGMGYGEENDLCMRINKDGYVSLLANRAYVQHLRSRSFGTKDRARLVEEHEKILLSRFPFYYDLVRDYIEGRVDPIDWFADLIGGSQLRRKVFIPIFSLAPDITNDKTARLLSLLKTLKNNDDIEYTIGASPRIAQALQVHSLGLRIIETDDWREEMFHAVYIPYVLTDVEELIAFNRCSLKLVVTIDQLEIMRGGILAKDFSRRTVLVDTLRLADTVLYSDVRREQLNYYEASAGVLPSHKLVDISNSKQQMIKDVILRVLQTGIDETALRARWHYLRAIKSYTAAASKNTVQPRVLFKKLRSFIRG